MKLIKEFYRFTKHILENRTLLFTLAINDFKEQYLGSYLGLIWAVLRPSLFILIVWFIFSVGFKGKPIDSEVPFVVYLLTGYVPWFFFSEAVIGGMNAVINNRFLVKKVAFRVSILPVVKVTSALFLHMIFLTILVSVMFLYGFTPTLYWLQLPFYLLSMTMLLLGLSWMMSALRVFLKDVAQIIGVILQLGFWVTPIFWSLKMVPEKYMPLMQLNPMIYIIEGYRNSLINGVWLWEHSEFALSFWSYVTFFFIVGGIVFKRLRPHFGDVL